MKKAGILIITTMLLGWTMFTMPAHAQVPEEKKRLIAELLDKTKTKEMALQVSSQMLSAMTQQDMKDGKLTPIQLSQIQMASSAIMKESMDKGEFYEIIYPVYNKYFSEDDLKQIIAFYDSPTGQKFIAVSPDLTKDTIQASQKWVASLMPQIQMQIMSILQK